MVHRAAIAIVKICGENVENYKSRVLVARSGNRTADRTLGQRDVIHWATGIPSEEQILLGYEVKQISSVDLSVKRLLKMS